jgi:A/G-specific adenine glycosylase
VVAIAAALLRHFDAHRRAMPWRETRDPYAIWVSEVMLQQTRVDTVRPYYERWLRRFPTVGALADAELDDVLREWQGLGYYRRARNLHRAARMVRERYHGELPREPAALRALPGVGEYTAGAVASIAFGARVPAVDGNVRRVLARLYDLADPGPAELRDRAAALIPAGRPGDFNESLMELGATTCSPRAPDCGACPIAEWCAARALGVQEERPVRKRRGPVPAITVVTAVLARPGGGLLLTRRPETGLLAGLWEFPADDGTGWIERLTAGAGTVQPLPRVRQVFSHLIATYQPTLYLLPVGTTEDQAAERSGDPVMAWVPPAQLDDYALPVAQQKIAAAARTALDAS